MSDRMRPHTSFIVVPHGGESRTYRVSHRRLSFAKAAAATLLMAVLLGSGSWWFLAQRAARVGSLEAEVARLRGDSARVEGLARRLADVERRYERIRGMFGSVDATASDAWLPLPSGVRATPDAPGSGPDSRPTSWPLTERGFVTQELLAGGEGEHPGLDIAIPSDSYIRAAGAGTVVDAGTDEVYGSFVVIDHGEGYSTLYGHASSLLVQRGDRVRRNQVIALSGSTGRSTAPHLHFEILLDGQAVDPLSLVSQP